MYYRHNTVRDVSDGVRYLFSGQSDTRGATYRHVSKQTSYGVQVRPEFPQKTHLRCCPVRKRNGDRVPRQAYTLHRRTGYVYIIRNETERVLYASVRKEQGTYESA